MHQTHKPTPNELLVLIKNRKIIEKNCDSNRGAQTYYVSVRSPAPYQHDHHEALTADIVFKPFIIPQIHILNVHILTVTSFLLVDRFLSLSVCDEISVVCHR